MTSQFAAARRADGYAAQLSARALIPLLGYLRALGVAPPRMPEPEPEAPGDRLIGRFAGYLARERCLAADSIRSYTGVARRFMAEVDVEGLTAADVTGFTRRECGRRGVASAKATVTGLRALLRFLHVDGRSPRRWRARCRRRPGMRWPRCPGRWSPGRSRRCWLPATGHRDRAPGLRGPAAAGPAGPAGRRGRRARPGRHRLAARRDHGPRQGRPPRPAAAAGRYLQLSRSTCR